MPGHRGAGPGSRCRRCRVPCVRRTRAVAPCLLCEVLAVILVLGVGVALALTLAWLLLRNYGSLGASLPSTSSVVAVLVRGCPFLLAWTVPCFSLGAWALGRAASSVAFHPSPSLGSARLVVLGSVSTFWNGLSILSWNGCLSFLGNLSLRLRWRLIPSLPRAPCIFMPGLSRKSGWECWSGSSSTSLRGS